MCCIAASLPCCNLYQLPQFPWDTGPLLALQAVLLLPVHCTPQLDALELCISLGKDEFMHVYQGAETLVVGAEERVSPGSTATGHLLSQCQSQVLCLCHVGKAHGVLRKALEKAPCFSL